jgi:hypothetical protein
MAFCSKLALGQPDAAKQRHSGQQHVISPWLEMAIVIQEKTHVE